MNDTFAREWLTIGHHRIVVHQRVGAPGTTVRLAAMIAAWILDEWGSTARVVEVWFDNKHTSHLTVTLGTDTPDDDGAEDCARSIETALSCVFDWGMDHVVKVAIVPEGFTQSDGYDRTEHIVKSVLTKNGKECYLR